VDPPQEDEVVDDEDLFAHILFPKREKKTFVDVMQEIKKKQRNLVSSQEIWQRCP
jgi:hypothetical protein